MTISKTNIHDKNFRQRLLEAVFKGEANEARLLCDKLTSKQPYNKEYRNLENLVIDKFYG